MKKTVICILALSLMLSFAACNNINIPSSSATPQATSSAIPEPSNEIQSPDAALMMETIEKLSQTPRGQENEEGLAAARSLIRYAFKSYGLEVTTQEFSVPGESDNSDYQSVNIIGTLYPNTENKTTDILVVGAHYDGSVDFPSANDNGSGVAVMLELARLLQGVKTDTEIRFIAFDAEETGLWGSTHYVNALSASEVNRSVGILNFDMLAAAKAGQVLAYLDVEEENFLSEILTSDPLFSDAGLMLMPYGGSDSTAFAAKVIPSLTFSHEPVDGEYHSKGDTMDSIDPTLLAYAASAGQAVIDDIISEKTQSYAGKSKSVDGTVYTIDENMFFPAGDSIKAIEDKAGIKLTQIESPNEAFLYAARVKLFSLPEMLTLTMSYPVSDTYGYQVKLDGVSLENIIAVLDKTFGPKAEATSEQGTQYKWYNTFGNVYSILPGGKNGEFYLDIGAYDTGISEGYTLNNGELVRMEDADPFSGVTVTYTKKGNEIIRAEQRNKPSDTLTVTDAAKEAWNKIKAYLTPQEIADIGFIQLTSDGIGESVISLSWANESEITEEPHMLKDYLEDGDSAETSHALPGLHISFDYLDITNPNGTAYTQADLEKAMQAARANYEESKNIAQ